MSLLELPGWFTYNSIPYPHNPAHSSRKWLSWSHQEVGSTCAADMWIQMKHFLWRKQNISVTHNVTSRWSIGSLETHYNTTLEFHDNLSSVIVNQKSIYLGDQCIEASYLQRHTCSVMLAVWCLQCDVFTSCGIPFRLLTASCVTRASAFTVTVYCTSNLTNSRKPIWTTMGYQKHKKILRN